MSTSQSAAEALGGRRLRQTWAELWLEATPWPTRLPSRLCDRATRNNSGARESETETLEIMMRETAELDLTPEQRQRVAEGWLALVGRLMDVAVVLFGGEGGDGFEAALIDEADEDGREDALQMLALAHPETHGQLWIRANLRQEAKGRRARHEFMRHYGPAGRPMRPSHGAGQEARSA